MSNVQYEERDRIAIIRMDDGKVNALSPDLIQNLAAAFDRAREHSRAIALFGRPDRFCAGFDLRVMMSGLDELRALVGEGCELLMRIYEHPLPVVVGCTGHALAAGILLVATGDVRIGVRGDFKLGLNELTKSMPVPVFAQELARDRLDPRELVAATLGATIYKPEDALRVGWLDQLVDASELEQRVLEAARRMARHSGSSFAVTKRTLRHRTIDYVRHTLQANLQEFAIQSN
jgi:enoyl-CoA hydratase